MWLNRRKTGAMLTLTNNGTLWHRADFPSKNASSDGQNCEGKECGRHIIELHKMSKIGENALNG